MPKTKIKANRKLLENAVAIAVQFHNDDGYQEFYDDVCDEVGGFVGIWNMIVDAAKVFTQVEVDSKLEAGEGYDWIEAIDRFSVSLIETEDFSDKAFTTLAKLAIKGAKY